MFQELLQELDDKDRISGEIDSNAKTILPNPDTTTFQVKIIGAKNLKAQKFRAPDAYVVMTLNEQIVGATEIIRNNANPNWHCYYTVQLPKELNTDSKAFMQVAVYHDNSLGDEIKIGGCAVFLRDLKIQNYLSHNMSINLRPQGSMLIRIRKDGEIEDTEWYIKRSQEVVRFTIEDMIHTISSKVYLISCRY
jgi:hypothetical protein